MRGRAAVAAGRAGAAMDEESIGLFGLVLIVTAMAVSQPLLKHPIIPTLPDVQWENVLSVIGCSDTDSENCSMALAQ
jgi:hypothetical protein